MAQIIMRENVPKFGWKDKIGYALGDFGCNLSFVMQSSFFMVYYVTCLGINPAHYGLLILLTKIWDGVNDPLVGSLTDKLRPKNGKDKFKPWIFFGSFLLAGVTMLMFMPLHNASYAIRLLACVVSYVMWDMCYTIVNVPYGTMSSVMTTNELERADLSKWRAAGSLLGNVPAGVILPLFLYNQVTGDPIQSRFLWTAVVMGLMTWVCLQATIKLCTERIIHVEEPAEKKQEQPHFFRTFLNCMQSRPMVGLIIASVALLMFMQSNNSTNQYVFMLYYNDTNWISVAMLMNYVAQIAMMILIRPLLKKFDRKALCSIPFIAIIGITVFMIVTPMSSPISWVICQFLIGMLQGSFVTLVWALISDCIDYMEASTGRREEGSVYSCVTLFRKIGSGVGSALLGVALTWTGYNETLDVASQAANVGVNVKNLAAAYPLIGAILIFVSMGLIYTLDNKKMEEVEKKLGRSTSLEVNIQSSHDD